jgi:hypothetical protein
MLPEKMSQAMKPYGVQPGIAEDDLGHASRCRVFSKYRLNVLSQSFKQDNRPCPFLCAGRKFDEAHKKTKQINSPNHCEVKLML